MRALRCVLWMLAPTIVVAAVLVPAANAVEYNQIELGTTGPFTWSRPVW